MLLEATVLIFHAVEATAMQAQEMLLKCLPNCRPVKMPCIMPVIHPIIHCLLILRKFRYVIQQWLLSKQLSRNVRRKVALRLVIALKQMI
jgi:hypothetical protein